MESKGSKNMFQILIPRYLRSVLGIPDGVSWLREMNIKISKIGYLIYSLLFLILLYSLVFLPMVDYRNMEIREEQFEAARDFIGRDWLKSKESEFYESEKIDHRYGEAPPEIVRLFRIAKMDLAGDGEELFNERELRENAVEFLYIGQVVKSVQDLDVITPSGDIQETTSVQNQFQEFLRNDDSIWSAFYEMEAASRYLDAGYEVAFINEDLTDTKSPDLEIRDLDQRVQIECKRCSRQSDKAQTESNIFEKLFQSVKSRIEYESYIALFDLEVLPEGNQVDSIESEVPRSPTIGPNSPISLRFGDLYVIEFAQPDIIEQPIPGLEGFEILSEFYEVYVRTVLASRLGVDRTASELGYWEFDSSYQRSATIARHKDPIWIGIKQSRGSESLSRFRNQFKGVSSKFADCSGLLHIHLSDFRPGDAHQKLQLRQQAAGELRHRPEISGVFVDGRDIRYEEHGVGVDTPSMYVPHYNPDYKPPADIGLYESDHEDAVAYDRVVSDADEELMSDPEGFRKAIEQSEGTISFRFQPERTLDVDESKKIIDIESQDSDKRVVLEITPESAFKLTREVHDDIYICEVDNSGFPRNSRYHFFLIWDEEMTKLAVGPSEGEDLRDTVCEESIKK
jgi:hypothetical protein